LSLAAKSKLLADLKTRAQKLGFVQLGVSLADAPEIWRSQLTDAIQQNWHGDMDWIEETFERRVTPLALWPEAKISNCSRL